MTLTNNRQEERAHHHPLLLRPLLQNPLVSKFNNDPSTMNRPRLLLECWHFPNKDKANSKVCFNLFLFNPFIGSDSKAQHQNSVVYIPHHTVNMPVPIPQAAAAGGLPGGQMPLPPPPKPPLNLQQPSAGNVVPHALPQQLPSLSTTAAPNNPVNNSGHIPSLMSLPLAPAQTFPHNSKYS